MEHPILFSGQMVNAILTGKKTQTRRVIKPQSLLDNHTRVDACYKCPYGAPGDLLWVRETFDVRTVAGDTVVFYRADCGSDGDGAKWKPSIFMPRALSRISLKITDVRVERLQEMKREEAEAEGIGDSPLWRPAFKQLWDAINAKRGHSWDSNPWVWVIKFEVI